MFKVTLMDYSTNNEVFFLINNKISASEFCEVNQYLKSVTKTVNNLDFNLNEEDNL